MVAGARAEGGTHAISACVQRTIQSIREIVGDHSDADIYAALRESNMDPNETAQKLLNQDPFHEVKRKRDKKKVNTGFKNSAEEKNPMEHNIQWARSSTSLDRNVRRGGYVRNSVPDAGISKEFRIVKDNRLNQAANRDINPEALQHPVSRTEKVVSNVPGRSSTGSLGDRNHSSATNSEGHRLGGDGAHGSSSGYSNDAESNHTGRPKFTEEMRSAVSVSTSKGQREVYHNSQLFTASTSTSSEVGMYPSSTDPIHLPSTASRSDRTIGAIQREVVGVRRRYSNYPATQPSVDVPSSTESFRQSIVMPKSSQLTQTPSAETNTPSTYFNRSFSSIQYTSRQHPHYVAHQKVMQLNMEWKPKSIQKNNNSPGVIGSALGPSLTSTDSTGGSRLGNISGLSEKLSGINVSENLHVIIPHHLRVPESERSGLMFGSFGAESDCTRTSMPLQTYENAEESSNEPSVSVSASVPAGSNEDASASEQEDLVDCKARASRSDSPASSAECEKPPAVGSESPSQNIENYADIGLVQIHSPPYGSTELPQLQSSPGLSHFSAYDTQEDVPFFRTVMEDNIHGQGFPSHTEALSSHVANSCPPSIAAMVQQQPVQQQQQQPVAQLYPQVHISHFPNFVPYRHIFSPVYMPPMAMPNYSNNPTYPHLSSGSSYVLMPGGSSHIASGGMKYAASPYKPVPAGSPTAHGSYTNPAGFAIGPSGTVGAATGLEDVSRIKYKDNNLYVSNPQAEASDIWVQTPRDLPSLQSTPFYNLPGQAPHAAFVPTHAGHASFNAAAQSSHVQYQSLYHPPQPASLANPHHLVHQQVPTGLGGSVGVGVAAPGPQVGTYQQPQLGHLNWTANF